MDKKDLLKECEKVFEELSITGEESSFLFKSTVLQSDSLLWFEHRKGRLTASKFGAITRTSLESPSKSLVDSILQRKSIPKTAAMQWGIQKEPVAREAYFVKVKNKHVSFNLDMAGLYVNPESPHLGASPDGLIFCDCCGPGLLEIKCPFSVRNENPTAAPYIKPKEDGTLQLCRKHNYYFQVQGQMAVMELSYCDFVCWTPCDLFIERITYDSETVNEMIPKLDSFFIQVILPQVLCDGEDQNETADSNDVFCFCKRGEYGKMIACDSPHCEFTWFHYGCINLPDSFEPGEEEWLCPECTKKATHLPMYSS